MKFPQKASYNQMLSYLRELEVHFMEAAILKTVRDLGVSGTLYKLLK